jgi:hypothetical protein
MREPLGYESEEEEYERLRISCEQEIKDNRGSKNLDLAFRIRPLAKLLQLDLFATQLLMHYTRLPIETLKRRSSRARQDTSKLLLNAAIAFREAEDNCEGMTEKMGKK